MEIQCMFRSCDKMFWHGSNKSSIKPSQVADCEAYVFMKFAWFAPHFHLFFSWIDILNRDE